MRFFTQPTKILIALILSAGVGLSLAADKEKTKPIKPPTKQTQVIRAETYKKMEAAQKSFDGKDFKAAISQLDELKNRQDKLNDYERATLFSLYAAVYYAQEQVPQAIAAYLDVLKQPNLTDGLRDSSLYALSQLYFISESYGKAIAVLQKWIGVAAEPKPEAYTLLAQAYYQTQKFGEAEKALITALRISQERGQKPKENALALLRAIYFEKKDYPKATKVLEILVTSYPERATYWQQLAGMKGLQEKSREQLNLMHAAFRIKLLNGESDQLNLARLYMMQDAPYPAVRLIAQGIKAKTIKQNVDTLQLLAQALSMSREYRQQIPVLTTLAEMSGEAKHYIYLGQAYNELGEWTKAIEALRAALNAKNLDRRGDVQMQLGSALFNANRLGEARQAFVAAQQTPKLAEQAAQWVKFVDTEIQRREAVGAG